MGDSIQRPLAGQTAWVTGGGSGIGRAIACALADGGAEVIVSGRRPEPLEATASAIAGRGGVARAFDCDVRDRLAIARLIAHSRPIDLLVNNAGVFSGSGPLWEVDIGEWWLNFEVNVLGAACCAAAVLPSMLARGSGRIVNIVSSSAAGGSPMQSGYASSKTALLRLSEALNGQVSERGVRVFALDPGLVYTEMAEALLNTDEGRRLFPGWDEWWQRYHQPPDRAASVVLAIATGAADGLAGRYLTAMDDVRALAARADEVAAADLRSLRIRWEEDGSPYA